MGQSPAGVDPDFAREVLADLYAYRRKRRWVAWLLWATVGPLGGHRLYVERTWSALAMFFTGGGGGFWWLADVAFVNRLVGAHNAEQTRREAEGLAPVELAFMPPLSEDVLREPPAWTLSWQARSRTRRLMRLAGDALVLLVAGSALGALAGEGGVTEAIVAVTALVLVTLLGGRVGALARVPLARSLVRWTHRLRLFYYFNAPGTPPGLLLRTFTGAVYAPFRQRDRAEVRLYLELGAAFTIGFLLLNVVNALVLPVVRGGLGTLSPAHVAGEWLAESLLTFIVTSAFAAPIGAILTLYLLTRRAHTVARLLGLGTLACIGMVWLL